MRIFSGIKPSGELHIGNYIGALKQFLKLQEEHESFFSIVDLHALTEHPGASNLRNWTLAAAIGYLATGIDPQKSTLFAQSDVPAHSEMMWFLTTLTPVNELQRMTQYKDKTQAAKKKDFINAGLLLYPVLMAADILLYRAEAVPVGEDQLQHLELTRRLARRFNDRYPPRYLPEPQTLLPNEGARIMSLADPQKKMSKSHGPDTYISLFDPPDVIVQKVKRAVTDSGKKVTYDPKKRPAISNLLTIYASFRDEPPKVSAKRFAASGYATLKHALAELLTEKLAPFRERRAALMQSPAHVRAILDRGAERARAVSAETLCEMRRRMGLP